MRRVIVTRPREHAERLAARLSAIEMEPVIVPTVAFAPPATYAPLDDAVRHLDRYAWILFTSRTGVRVFFERMAAGPRALPEHLRWAAVGPGTAEALRGRGIREVWIPSRYLSEAAGAELPAQRGDRVLRIRAEAASPLPAERLRGRGVEVDEVVAYRTVLGPPESVPLLRQAVALGADGVIFTSASTVRGFARLIQVAALEHEIGRLTLIAIGPVTAEAIRALGWPVHLVAAEHSVDGIAVLFEGRHVDAASGLARN
ncbi:MAG: uroporphyrinogen-III synthase [Armatimonadetes bacterium]|nr:uroporphyrinogen-III synthase [Armatimonadota bacterium]